MSKPGQSACADATRCGLPAEVANVWFTDPPYYDGVAYADLADFFFVWLKRILPESRLLRDPFDSANPLTPKAPEIIQDPALTVGSIKKDGRFYESAMGTAFAEGRRLLRPDGIGCVVFAHKSTEGWEALLSGIIQSRWRVEASWPVTTERGVRFVSQESAALATSVHLVCRPRVNRCTGEWETLLRDLPKRIGDWMERLSGEGIRGADLVFSCVGPALELFSRFDRVETAEGSDVKLSEFLQKVWEVVGRTALQQVLGTAEALARNSAAGALEEDARLTALFLWALQSTATEELNTSDVQVSDADDDDDSESAKEDAGYVLPYDIVRRFAQPLGIHLDRLEVEGIIKRSKGVVRLIAPTEREEKLFGKGGLPRFARSVQKRPDQPIQFFLFPTDEDEGPPLAATRPAGRAQKGVVEPRKQPTTQDYVHAAMVLQAGGQAHLLRSLIKSEIDPGQTSSGCPTRFRPFTHAPAKRNGYSMRCCWQCPGEGYVAQ